MRASRSESGRIERNRRDEARPAERADRIERDRRGEARATERADRIERNRGGERHRGGSYDRNRGGRNDSYRDRSNDRYRGNDRGYRSEHRSHGHRQPYYAQGRISRYHRYGHGYRVYIVGVPYPFFVPDHHWHHDRFRVGLSIRLGGYYNDLGYYDYYDGRSRGEIRGVVESVDYRRDTFIVRNEATGSFVTVVMHDRRRDVRAGDYVELYGDWTRSGVFRAYDVDLLDYDRDYRRY